MNKTNDLFPQHGDLVEIVPYKGYLFNCNNLTQWAHEVVGRKGKVDGWLSVFPHSIAVSFIDGGGVVVAPCCVRIIEPADRRWNGKLKCDEWVWIKRPSDKKRHRAQIIKTNPVMAYIYPSESKEILLHEWILEKAPAPRQSNLKDLNDLEL